MVKQIPGKCPDRLHLPFSARSETDSKCRSRLFLEHDGKNIVSEMAAWYWNSGKGRYNTYTQTKKNELLDIYANYRKDLSSINSRIDFTAGYSWQHFYREGSYLERNYAKTITYQDNEYFTESYLISFFGRLNYVFMNRYLLTFTLRDDGSSKFAKENDGASSPPLLLHGISKKRATQKRKPCKCSQTSSWLRNYRPAGYWR
jgi:hypothetical protein